MSAPTREQLIEALRVLGHSKRSIHKILTSAEWCAKTLKENKRRGEMPHIGAFNMKTDLNDHFPALWAHVNHSKPNT